MYTFPFVLTGKPIHTENRSQFPSVVTKVQERGLDVGSLVLLGQFSVTFEYRPGSLHNNADGMSQQCGQCRRPDCPVSAIDLPTGETDTQSVLIDQPFATSEMGDSMDADCYRNFLVRRGWPPLLATTDWEFESGLSGSSLAPSVPTFRGLSASGPS